jgi:hypothetical protein
MAYSDFTYSELIKRFGLTLDEGQDLFAATLEVQPSALLRATLDETVPLALAIQTEKARSEMIIAPILVETRRVAEHQISLFSGVDFTVDPAQGLNGVCDYLFSAGPEQLFVRAPVLAIVEAKNENMKAGIPQCAAAMIAAQRFNEREETGIATISGVVTTGNIWRFLQLDGATLLVDQPEYYIENVAKILGILLHLVRAARQAG